MLAESANGYEVYVNLLVSPAGRYISRAPYVLNLLKEVLTPMRLTKVRHSIEHDMGRTIGNTDIIETTDKDVIFYAQPNKKAVYSRYAKNRYPSPSQHLTIIIEQDTEGNYEVTDTWIGPCSPPFPGDEHEDAKSKNYWESHALAQDFHSVQSKTITKICPY